MKLLRITPGSASLYKRVRLAALESDPGAFSSTFQREVAFPDTEWQRRGESFTGEDRIGFLALDEYGSGCGLIVCFRDETQWDLFEVLSMWVAPYARRVGVGSLLLEGVTNWAAEVGARTLRLSVMRKNKVAMAFYLQKGFHGAPEGGAEQSPEILLMERIFF